MRTALITGITGQDGSYLTELLVGKGYDVHGVVRRASTFNTGRIEHLYDNPKLKLHYGDLTDSNSLTKVLRNTEPDEVYNLGAQSHVRLSFDIPVYTQDIAGLGTMRLLEALREYQSATTKQVKFYQASSSEMFGLVRETPQTETTPFHPRSPYAIGKLAAYWSTINYREAYGMHTSNGILFNHESPRRGETFVTRKITRAVGRIKCGLQNTLSLGNLDAQRDWGFAGDYVEAMWLMLQQPTGDDYVVATGETHSVREFLELAFGHVGLHYTDFVKHDPKYVRPAEVDLLLGDATKAQKKLGWIPKVGFKELVETMVDSDLELATTEKNTR